MAYKFQRGPAVASGSFTAEEGLTSSNSLTVSAGTVTLPNSSVATTALAASSVTIGSTSVSLGGVAATSLDGLTTVDTTNIEVTNIKAKDGTAAVTVADTTGHVTITNLTGTSVAINGGAINGTTIGATTQSSVRATTLSASSTITVDGAATFKGDVTLGDAGADTIYVNGLFTSSLNPKVNNEGNVGVPGNLWAGVSATELSASNRVRAGNSITGQTLTASVGATLAATVVTTITGSSTATFQSMTSNNVTIGGGTINATPIGGTTQAAGQFTTLSASSNLQVGSSITASSGVRVSSGGVTVTDGGLTVSLGDSSVQKLTVNGDLIVLGNTFSASVGTLVIEDKQIVLADGAADRTVANGAGFFVSGASVQWTYKNDGEGAAASSNDIFVASSSAGLIDIQAANFYGTFNGSLVGSMASTVSASVGGATLVTGVNYFGTVGGAVSVTLPASAGLTVGNSVKVKAGSDCSTTNTITINKDGSQTIDGVTFVVLESPWAALEFVYVASDTWRIF